jgi:polyisoprenoid-binding protein YceI
MLKTLFFPCLVLAAALAAAQATRAAPVTYALDEAASTVAFETDFGPDLITGAIPLATADLRLDFENVANSSVSVVLNVSGATASFPFAAQALKGPKVLDARSFPQMSFESTKVTRTDDGAEVTGNMTIRGVTKPVTLRAVMTRPKGSAPDDLDRLTMRLSGRVSRADFGATGWSDMVGDEVRILITARIDAKG